MPGESLVCVWQVLGAVAADRQKSEKQRLKDITRRLAEQGLFAFSEDNFNKAFPDDNVAFDEFKIFVIHVLRDEDTPTRSFVQQLETACFHLCKASYHTDLDEGDLMKLWQIANKLSVEGTVPPIILQDELNLLAQRLAVHTDVDWSLVEDNFKVESVTFAQLLKLFDEFFFRESKRQQVKACLSDAYDWFVVQVLRSGWLQKRTKNGPNWTNWVRRWTVLTPTRLLFYAAECSSVSAERKSEFLVSDTSVLESQQPYKSGSKKITGRFKLSNPPTAVCELATNDPLTKKEWMSAFRTLKTCHEKDTTPLESLLRERFNIKMEFFRRAMENEARIDELLSKSSKSLGKTPVECKESENALQNVFGIWSKNRSEDVTDGPEVSGPKEGDDEYENEDDEPTDEAKLKVIFMKLDDDGNGFVDENEFAKYTKELGLCLDGPELNMVFATVDKNGNGKIEFDEFLDYFSERILGEASVGQDVSSLRKAFMEADRNGTGKINFKEMSEYFWEKKKDVRMSKLMQSFNAMEMSGDGEMDFDEFRNLLAKEGSLASAITEGDLKKDSGDDIGSLQKRLQETYENTESDDLAGFIQDRWKVFADFKRAGDKGDLVMTGDKEMSKDLLPGTYSLVDLACFNDLPPLEPKHTIVKGAEWVSSNTPGKSGKLILPQAFDGCIETDFATNEHLRFYGCSFAENRAIEVSLCYRHGVQDFTYENSYLEDYAEVRGCGIETHQFSHLDCPLDSDNGLFVLGKFVGKDLFLTAFRLPARHTLYVPEGTVHSNDYLTGTWRTMLSDEAEIDHVLLTKKVAKGDGTVYEKMRFEFK